ncbi:KEOPS complex subunit Pcc1 [Halorubrum trueperi]|uniref:KEOPS complex subunit Pcc1 n=1 Tax=Halorubrum trueperi TaxID=2004704 RepID=A0ABD5UFH4_9EURY
MIGNEPRTDGGSREDGTTDGGSREDGTTDDESHDDGTTRTATVRTTHADAGLVAAALVPDNTESMAIRVDGDAIECAVERRTTGGLRSTVDDYVVNLHVADRLVDRARAHLAPADGGGRPSDTNADTNTNT